MHRKYLLAGIITLLSVSLLVSLGYIFLHHDEPTFIREETTSQIPTLHSAPSHAVLLDSLNLTDSTVYDAGANICTANRLNMGITVDPCVAASVDGRDITQEVTFAWSGAQTQGVSWLFVYDGDIQKGKLELWGNWSYTTIESVHDYQWITNYQIDGVANSTNLGTPDTRCVIGSPNNSKMYSVVFTNNSASVYCFSTITTVNATTYRISGNIDTYTPTPVTTYRLGYKDVTSNVVNLGKILGGASFYKVEDYQFSPGEIVKTRWTFTADKAAKKGKWSIFGYDSSLSVSDAIAQNKYIYLDPWWNPAWLYKQNVTLSGLDYVALNITYNAHMQKDFSDIRFTDASESYSLPYWIAFKNDSNYAQVRVASNKNRTIYLYYGNTTPVSTASSVRAVYGTSLVSYWAFENPLDLYADATGTNNFTAGGVGSPIINRSGWLGSGATFTSSNYLTIASAAGVPIGNESRTVGGFGRFDNGAETDCKVVSWSTTASTRRVYAINTNPSTLDVGVTTYGSDGSIGTLTGLNAWNSIYATIGKEETMTRGYVNKINGNYSHTVILNTGNTGFFVNRASWADAAKCTVTLDEIAVYNSSLTADQIVALENQQYLLNATYSAEIPLGSSPPYFTVIPPYTFLLLGQSLGVQFTATTSTSTLDTYNVNDSRFVINDSGWLSNLTSLTVGLYYLNVSANDTDGRSNYTIWQLTANSFLFNNTVYNSSTYELSQEGFILNMSYDPAAYSFVTAQLHYDNLTFPATVYGDRGQIRFENSISIPSVGVKRNVTFYWTASIVSPTTTSYYNSSFYNVTVWPINFTLCSGGTNSNLTLNFTAYDERMLSRVTPFSFQSTFNIWANDPTMMKNISFNNTGVGEVDICSSPGNIPYHANALIQYSDVGSINYTTRTFFLVGTILSNVTQNISLYLLNRTYSTSFIETLVDNQNKPVSGAYIFAQRYYPATDTWRTVEASRTSDVGSTIGDFEINTPDYRFYILDSNGTQLYSSGVQKVYPTTVPYTLYFFLPTQTSSPLELFKNVSNYRVVNYIVNRTEGVVIYSYIDSAPTPRTTHFFVYFLNTSSKNNRVLCDNSSTLGANTFSCNFLGQNGTMTVSVYVDNALVWLENVNLGTLSRTFGRTNWFIGWLIILTCAATGFYNISVAIVLTNVGVWVVDLLGYIPFGGVFITAMAAISVIALVELNT